MKTIAIAIAALATGCATAAYDPEATTHSDHFDLAGDGAEQLREAEEAYALFSELLQIDPGRAKLVIVADQAAFDRVAGEAAGAQGVYQVRARRIITFPQGDPRVVRHEVAHHFAVALVGELSPALDEGIAEVLEGAIRVDGRAHLPVVSPEHFERFLAGGVSVPGAGVHRHAHVDYAGAWALVAFALERESGPLRERLLALKKRAVAAPTPAELLAVAQKWKGELRRMVLSDAAAARVLGLLGDVDGLRDAWDRAHSGAPVVAIAGALARNGERQPLRQIAERLRCPHLLREVSQAVGREFRDAAELEAWLQ